MRYKFWALGFSSLMWFNAYAQQETVRINEIMALNESILADEDGAYSDWIELYNGGSDPVDLTDWTLTDDPADLRKWSFPAVEMAPGGFLLVFASGKDRYTAGKEIHTSFKLSGTGEYLALSDPEGAVITEFTPAYPDQQSDVSFGYYNGSCIFFSLPTPGSANLLGGSVIPAPSISVPHGLYEAPFDLEITSGLVNAELYYTMDGSTPTVEYGIYYTTPVHIDSTALLRAVAVVDDTRYSEVVTSSYIFLDDVIRQPNNPRGYPSAWGPYTAIEGTSIADYEMDPEMMADPEYAARVKKGLESLPVLSLVTDIDNLFSTSTDPETGGIYIHTGAPLSRTEDGLGKGWERPASLEYFNKTGTESFQVNCGLRLQGGHSRRPEKSPKHSFRIVFRSEYGPSELNYPLFNDPNATTTFNNLVLRAGFGLSWIHHSHAERMQAQYQQDIWTKDTQRAMGHPSSHSEYAHLFINGIYWGLYAPSERLDGDFAASYMGGAPGDYDVIKDYQDVVDGEITSWNKLFALANAGLESDEAYQKIQGNHPDGSRNPDIEPMVDVINLADYMLINFYGSNTDWDHHNWAAARNRVNPGSGFKFLCWDAEHMLKSVSGNELGENNDLCPSRLFQQMCQNESFLRLFADRVQRFCYHGGLLTPGSASGRWNERSGQVEMSIPVEAARWGDYRRDVHPYQAGGPFDLYNDENYWMPQRDFMTNTYFPQRTAIFLNQLRSAGLFPALEAPGFFINGDPYPGTPVEKGDALTMTSAGGVIYYTTNGIDPVDWGFQESGSGTGMIKQDAWLYDGPVTLDHSSHIMARTYLDGNWSAMTSCFVAFPEDYMDIKITEVHYNPLDEGTTPGSEFEFVELKNTGESTLDLGGLSFTEGVEYTFPPESELTPGGFMLLASNEMKFSERYGFFPEGQFKGNLNNGGEQIRVKGPGGETLILVLYDDQSPWPLLADGSGNSLVPVEFNPQGDPNVPQNWRDSHHMGGSPGRDDTEATKVEDRTTGNPGFELSQNHPNPFGELTYIGYHLPLDAVVDLSVYNFVGQKVAVLESGPRSAGHHVISWNGTDDSDQLTGEGIYFYRMVIRSQKGTQSLTRKMIRF